MATIASENMLKTILELHENGEQVIAARIAECLKISSPAVSVALKRLQRKRQVLTSNKRIIHLTAEGFRAASDLVRRHRLVERLLTDMLQMPWDKVHDEAEKLEHAISPELEKRLLELFGENGTCPHGSPFTPSLPLKRNAGCFRLTEAPQGAHLRVVRIAELHERENEFLKSLAVLRVAPGAEITLLRKSFDGVLELKVGEHKATFSSQSGSMIWVENAALSRGQPAPNHRGARKPARTRSGQNQHQPQ